MSEIVARLIESAVVCEPKDDEFKSTGRGIGRLLTDEHSATSFLRIL